MEERKEQEDKSYTCHYNEGVKRASIIGIDEAGRGPVIGPMVYCCAYCPVEYRNQLQEIGFADSKKLTPEKRRGLMKKICEEKELRKNIGWSVRVISARDISAAMLRPYPYNLNAQSQDATIQLIRDIIAAGVDAAEIYVDTVGMASTYQAKLSALFPQAEITVTQKADSLFPIVSAASICAKVTRNNIVACDATWGSGYPGDERTSTWLKNNMHPIFGWLSPHIRYSWQTVVNLLENADSKVSVEWEIKNSHNIFQSNTCSPNFYGSLITANEF